MDANYWLILGIALVIAEATIVPGIGFLFAGLAGIVLGGLLIFNILHVTDLTEQVVYFLLFTAVWWVILWAPLKKSMKKPKGEGYENMIGTYGEVEDERDLTPGKVGHIKWSGARMRAKIVPGSTTQRIKNGENVWVHDQKDGILLVDITKKE